MVEKTLPNETFILSQEPVLSQTNAADEVARSPITVGEFAYQLVADQFRCMVKQEQGVLADQDPEHLHHMRVGSRRLRTALQVFEAIVDLPKAAGNRPVQRLTRTLGQLRDLDVQLEALQNNYAELLTSKYEQKALKTTISSLKKQRKQAFNQVKHYLISGRYNRLKVAYKDWLKHPRYTTLAQLPLQLLLPELLSPLLAKLLLHPGWLIAVDDTSETSSLTLHDLRKTCKHVRYQAEFFIEYYEPSFKVWVDELKTLQDNLGKVQDTHVLLQLLNAETSEHQMMPELEQAIDRTRESAMQGWEQIRHRYLNPEFRHDLHIKILNPYLTV